MSPGILIAAAMAMAPAATVDEQTRRDIRCMVVMSAMAEDHRARGEQMEAGHADRAAAGFYERIVARNPGIDIAQAMAAEAAITGNRQLSEFKAGCIQERLRQLREVIDRGEPLRKGNR